MEYFTPINKDGMPFGVWCRQDNYTFKIGIANPKHNKHSHFYIEDGQTLEAAMAARFGAWFEHRKPWVLKEMKLKPGQYYERMARPNDQHPLDCRGASCPNSIGFEKQISISKGQLVSLVNRLEDIFQTIHPCVETFSAYGHEIRNLLILACTEVEAQWKGILATHNYPVTKHTTNDYVNLKSALRLDEYSVTLPFYPWLPKAHPFKKWEKSNPTQSLEWYSAYNQIKHDREEHFDKAQLKHAMNAVCACYIMLFAQYGGAESRKGRQEISNFFNIVDFPNWCPSEVYTYPYKSEHITFEYDPITYCF